MNIFKKMRDKRNKKTQLKKLSEYSNIFGTLDTLHAHHLLTWDTKARRLYIAEPVAVVMLSQGAMGWENFLQNVWQWTFFKEQQEAWDAYFLQEEIKAVQARKKQVAMLTKAEAESIRRARRDEILAEELETPKVEGFELFILGDAVDKPSEETDGTVAGIIAVGEYNPESGELSMAMWDEVKEAVEKMKEMESVAAPTPSNDTLGTLGTVATKEPDKGIRTDDLMALIARGNGEE